MEKISNPNQAFYEGDCLAFLLSNGKYGGAVVGKVHTYRKVNKYFLIITNLQEHRVPQLQDFLSAITYGRTRQNYLDDVLLLWDRTLPAFFGKFQIVGNLTLDLGKFRLGAFRHQNSYQELDFSVLRIPLIDYLERKPYSIASLTQAN